MAKRFVYISNEQELGVIPVSIDFEWYSGYSVVQKQKSISSLHENFRKRFCEKKVLEISSKSNEKLGIELSAFNLKTKTLTNGIEYSVESAFQSSKIFEKGGPFKDLLQKTSREAKRDERLRNSGNLIGFNFFGADIPITPKTLFYDWLYINVLLKNEKLKNDIMNYNSFTDIEFNEKRSINCQAYSAALFVSLVRNKIDISGIKNIRVFENLVKPVYEKKIEQGKFIFTNE